MGVFIASKLIFLHIKIKNMCADKKRFQSICVGSSKDKTTTKSHQLPIFASSSFVFEDAQEGIDIFTGQSDGHVYSRYANPTVDSVAEKIARLEAFDLDEEVFGIMTSSGMSAISGIIMGICEQGDKILTQGNLYGGTTELFAKIFSNLGIPPVFTDLSDMENLRAQLAKDSSIKVIYLETPANPTMACLDLAKIAQIAKEYKVTTIVDNTFCTPYLQRPLNFGIDYVVHSTTKYLNGHGNSIAGIMIGRKNEQYKRIWQVMKLVGTNCNPWDAWLTNNGLRTLALRMDRHSQNAMSLATFLEGHKHVNYVNYNGLESHPFHSIAKKQMSQFGGMLSFEIKGGSDAAITFMNRLKIATQAPTLGDVDTLVLHPMTSSHLNVDPELRAANGISEGLIRLSVGIEDVKDIIEDVDQALG